MNADDILKGLSDEDISSLKAAASSLFGSLPDSQDNGGKEKKEENQDGSFSMPDMETMQKIAKLMNALNKDDGRSALISALKPYLSDEKQRRADEAMRMIKLMDILPELGSQTGKDGLFGGLFG